MGDNMRRISRYPMRRKRKLRLRVKVLILVVAVGMLVWYVNSELNRLIDQVAYYEIHGMASEMINSAVNDILKDSQMADDQLIELTYNNENEVTAIQTNTVRINALKSDLTERILEEIRNLDTQTIDIPLGSLTGSELLNARGPDVTFEIYPNGEVNTKVISNFSSAGINQTNHRLILKLTVDIACVGWMGGSVTQVESEYLLAETVIVGTVPEQYSELLFESNSKI
jgi:sporulation protein YunB